MSERRQGKQPLMTEVGAPRVGAHAGGCKQKWVADERARRILLEMYDGRTATIDRLQQILGVPRWKVIRWASWLGLCRPMKRMPAWSDADDAYLERHLPTMSLDAIAQHLGRTKTAIRVRAKRMGVNKTNEGYTMRGLEIALGLDHRKIIKMVEQGWLKGSRRQSERTAGDMWIFTHTAIRRFVTEHPEEIDPRRMDWLWMVDLLAGGLGSLD